QWLTNYVVPAWKEYCAKENVDFKILLLISNALSHLVNLDDLHENVKVVFLPPNTTALIKPMDQGVIATYNAGLLINLSRPPTVKINQPFQQERKKEEEEEEPKRHLTLKGLAAAFQLIEEGIHMLGDEDSDHECFSKVLRNVMDNLRCYQEIYQEKKKNATSPLSIRS
ncbi:hypothetical protein ANN_19209, partial [Periplaneta americana]